MQEFGDFAKIDIDKLLAGMDDQFNRLGEFQRAAGDVVGRAEEENGMVVVEYGQNGVRELELHPKAMRLGSAELADLIKATLAEAVADYQRRFAELMAGVFGESGNPLADPEAALEEVKRAEAIHDRAFTDVMGELDRIRRRLEL
ncbi:YbaB/EbfC family nucleoid-associated protein [Nonomuraea sp. NPDC050783]|uniref:YbaB/EbfC family nucleoid-associated protein n=1 Tax=Nonomuraea sp. NPDC050783 TaxID=3154634 RepID=UPI003467AB85